MAESVEKPVLTQLQLMDSKAVTKALSSGIGEAQKRSAMTFFRLGEKYRQRAIKDGHWAPAAKAFGESAIRYPRPVALKEYAESSLRADAKIAATKGREAQIELLKDSLDLFASVLVADDILHELDRMRRAQLVQNRSCSEEFLNQGRAAAVCQPLRWLGLPVGKDASAPGARARLA